ncbi:MAG: hypothetical protein COZ07_08330 [Candidatus Infernicultor aquiphilus]|uniref:Uncharacterized protein n=1 Tax=Candidatus Infernicultor aquiphilus TaxID=1805029 RepID=A0A1J5H1X8_9BACT|nr:MAG: hypothetical protein AUK42_00505 [Candidatus Atribacteria bacterium CG2_30_33_13]PIW11392.1 MAG: hypothetical protein COW35_07170 [Candidatus Atribacteria bacterium CG17_big_fil_post_rev_8_21_14_2_50_34_11]PIY31707.1 MAG: hypothetical protein COZ07_08330 [Candidatus Atribacteria bacterium CG_4_10_14_3_um_filter_34_13]
MQLFAICKRGSINYKAWVYRIFIIWIVCPWSNVNSGILKWQWEKIVIAFWKEIAIYAKKLGIKLYFELYPGNLF